MNTALQCLFSIPAFRSALIKATTLPLVQTGKRGSGARAVWEPDEVAATLRDLFLDLQYGPRSYADPAAFAKCLQLDHAVQQVCEGGISIEGV